MDEQLKALACYGCPKQDTCPYNDAFDTEDSDCIKQYERASEFWNTVFC